MAPVLVFLIVLGGGVFQIVGFSTLFHIATTILVILLVALPPLGALLYLITRLTR